MALVCLTIGVFQLVFLDSFYLRNKKNILIQSWNMASEVDDIGGVTAQFDRFCSVNGLTYCLTDSTMSIWRTNSADGNMMAAKLLGILLEKDDASSEIIVKTDAYSIARSEDRFSDLSTLDMWGILPSGMYYLVTSPVQSMRDAARISTRFYVYAGIAAALVGALIMWAISGRLEKTIDQLQSEKADLERDIEEKERIDAMRKEFLDNVSHELKTPIALIQGYAEGLRDNVNDDEESRSYYSEVIIDEAARMNSLVRQITELSEIEDKKDLSIETFDLTELIRGVIEKMRVIIDKAGADLRFGEESPISVTGDPFMIEDVVTNYITNAINHLGGTGLIDIRCDVGEDTVETSVFNSGSPIPEDETDKIWTKFYKTDKARTRAYGGSGIGLSIVKAVMDAHGQNCRVQNYEDGVAFFFTLERAKK